MDTRLFLPACAALALALVALPVHAQNKNGRQMSVTTTVTAHMSGMTLPPHTMTRKVCMAPGKFDPRAMMKNNKKSDCKISNYKESGNTITYHMSCTKPEQMSGDATFHKGDDGSIKGRMNMAATAGGRHMTMEMHSEAHPVGTCTYTPPKQ